MSFIVSLYESLFRPRAALHELSGQELVELLTTPQRVFNITDKRTLPMWSPVRLSPSYRRKDNVVCASCLVLDYDDGTTIDVAMATWSRWYRILHTSWSHRPDKHRFRLVLPLQRDVTPEEYPALWRWAEVFADRQVDKACKDISRAWALPATDQSNKQHVGQFEWKVGTGDLLAPDEVIPLAPPPPIKVNYKRVMPSAVWSAHPASSWSSVPAAVVKRHGGGSTPTFKSWRTATTAHLVVGKDH